MNSEGTITYGLREAWQDYLANYPDDMPEDNLTGALKIITTNRLEGHDIPLESDIAKMIVEKLRERREKQECPTSQTAPRPPR